MEIKLLLTAAEALAGLAVPIACTQGCSRTCTNNKRNSHARNFKIVLDRNLNAAGEVL